MWTMQPFGFGSSLLKQSLATAAGSSLLSSECREIGHSCTTLHRNHNHPFRSGEIDLLALEQSVGCYNGKAADASFLGRS